VIYFLAAAVVLAGSGLWAQTAVDLDGTVLNSISRSGVAGVAVDLKGANKQQPVYRATTDFSGKFRIRNVASGEYAVSFEKEGFTASQSEGKRALTVPASGGSLTLVAELIPVGTIRGRVVDDERQSMGGRIAVELLRRNGRGESRSTYADGAGRFHFEELPPGTYLVRVNPNRRDATGRPQSGKFGQSPSSDGRTTVWSPVYFAGVRKREMAMPIVIRGGEDLAGHEIRVPATSSYRMRGVVLDDSGKPVKNASVKLKSADSSYFRFFPPEAEVVSGNDGTFEFASVGQGEWRIIAEVSGDRTELMGISRLEVTNRNIENVQVEMSASFTLGVLFEWQQSEGGNRPLRVPQVMLLPVDAASGQENYSDGADVERQHISHLYSGRYRVAAPSRPGFYLDAVMFGDQEVAGREIEIQPASPPIRLIYKSDGGQVRGTVDKGAGASVVLLPQDMESIDQAASVRCSEDGKFDIGGVRPGSYYAIAVHYLDWDALREPAFLQNLSAYSTIVRVNRKETAWVELRVAPVL
jgi:hypothetical protein